jgi:hypothetical protein
MRRINLSGICYIYQARLEATAALVQEGFAILGIAVGVALLFASQISSTSLAGSAAQLNSQLVGNAQVQIDARGPEGFGEGLISQVRGVPGVREALPIVEQQVNLSGPGGERSVDLIGVNPRLVHAGSRLPSRFAAEQLASLPAIALPEPLEREIGVAGQLARVKLQIGARVVRTFVATTLREGEIGGLVHDPVAIAPIGYAQRLAGARGQLSRIFVRYEEARAGAVRAALAGLAARWHVNFLPAKFDSSLFAVAVAPESKSEDLFSGISALVGFMFALNAMLITVPSRRKLIEDVRPHGATRLMTVQILLFDAAVIGVLACSLGLILGDVLSIVVFHSTPGYLAFAFPVGGHRIVSWHSVALAVIAGMAAAILGVLWPVREILARPLQQAQASVKRRRSLAAARLIGGLCCLGVTTLTLIADPRAAILGNVTLVVALVCLLPFLLDAFVACFERASRAFDDVSSALAIIELQTPQARVRALAIAAPPGGERRDRGDRRLRCRRVPGHAGEPEERPGCLGPRPGRERGHLGDAERQLEPAEHGCLQAGRRSCARARTGCESPGDLPGKLPGLGQAAAVGDRAARGRRTPPALQPACEREPGACDGALSPGRLGRAVAGARRRTAPACGRRVHAALAAAAADAPRGRDDQPRLAAGRDHPQLRRLRAGVGEPQSERIRDPDRPGCAGGGGARSCPAGAGTRERPHGGNG